MAPFLNHIVFNIIARELCVHCNPLDEESSSVTAIQLERDRLAALANLCKTCRTINEIVTPVLYHRPTCPPYRLTLLRQTMLRRRELGAYVKVLPLDNSHWPYVFPLGPRDTRLVEDEAAYCGRLDMLAAWGLPIVPRLLAADGGIGDLGPVGSLSAIVIGHCQNVEEIVLGGQYDVRWADFIAPGYLKCLRKLTTEHEYDSRQGLMQSLDSLLITAPNLEYFIGKGIRLIRNGLHMSNVREVRLEKAAITPLSLESILTACPLLERFSYTAANYVGWVLQFRPDEAQHVITANAPRLKSLTLDLSGWMFDNQIGGRQPMTTLVRLERLENLELDVSCIAANTPDLDDNLTDILVNLLPSSIRTFRLTQYPKASGDLHPMVFMPSAVLRLATEARKAFPDLRSVAFSGINCEEPNGLRGLLEAAEITYEWL